MIPWKRWILSQLHLSTRTPTTSTKRTFYPPTWSNITIVYNYPCSFGFHHTLSVWLIVVLCLNNRVSHVMVWSWSYSIRSCKGGWTKVVIITQGSPEDLSGFLVLHRLCHITLEYCYNVTMCYNVYIVILLLQPSPRVNCCRCVTDREWTGDSHTVQEDHMESVANHTAFMQSNLSHKLYLKSCSC